MIAEDPTVHKLAQRVELAAARKMPILVLGETGTGKEQMARHAHAASGRKGAFVPVNCAALTESLAEAELFGYADGAFTVRAARRRHRPRAPRADGGTLFLDEIGDMPIALQAILLRFLDDWTVRPIGRHLGHGRRVPRLRHQHDARQGDRRRPLPLRSPLSSQHGRGDAAAPRRAGGFRRDRAQAAGGDRAGATRSPTPALRRLAGRAWPGNIRELRNVHHALHPERRRRGSSTSR